MHHDGSMFEQVVRWCWCSLSNFSARITLRCLEIKISTRRNMKTASYLRSGRKERNMIGCYEAYALKILFFTWMMMKTAPYSSKWSEAERNILSFEGKWLAVDLTQVYIQNIIFSHDVHHATIFSNFDCQISKWWSSLVDCGQYSKPMKHHGREIFFLRLTSPQANGPILSNIPSFLHWLYSVAL